MRSAPSILHLDLDAFFAAVEQRDKPSLRGKPVVVGGLGQRGVVATASYEARAFGIRSAMPTHEARRRCPHAAFLAGRFGAYRTASRQVLGILRSVSPVVEPLSLDEAFVDLACADPPIELSAAGLDDLVTRLKQRVAESTGGLRASVGIATSKLIAKIATELCKPDGFRVVQPGSEAALLRPLPVSVIPGVGPVTAERLRRVGVATVGDLQGIGTAELAQSIGRAHAQALQDLAQARDDRPVEPDREAKSISVEDTFEVDLTDRTALETILLRDAGQVAGRLKAARLFARTVTIKVRLHDFTTQTRSRTLQSPTDSAELVGELARSLLAGVDLTGGVRLLGVGVAGLSDVVQDRLFDLGGDTGAPARDYPAAVPVQLPGGASSQMRPRFGRLWAPGSDVEHHRHGRGWVWGSGLGRVTVRFETADTPPGPVRTFATDDPELRLLTH